jgi:DNA-binding PadR family transcriptional regulator
MTRTGLDEPTDFLPLAAADFQVLLLLAASPLHPYGISKAVADNPTLGVRLEIGSLYRMLNRMQTAGLIEEADGEGSDAGPTARRRVFRISTFGRRVAKAEAKRLELVVEAARLQKFLPQGRVS